MMKKERGGLAYVLFLNAGGLVAAFQIGKAVVALPLLQQELGLGIGQAAWLLSIFAVLAACAGFPIGMVGRRLGARNVVIGGMATIGVASLVGAFATAAPLLLASRIVEGIAFLGTVTAIPDLLNRAVSPARRDLAFGFWSAYLPNGQCLMLLLGPFLALAGWRALWIGNGVLALAFALAALVLVPKPDPASTPPRRPILAEGRAALRSPGALLLPAAFGAYTFLYFSLSGFLPVLLVSQLGLSLASASLFTALGVFGTSLGNMSAGLLPRLGAPLWLAPAAAFLVYGVCVLLVFDAGLSPLPLALCAALALTIGGAAPGTIMVALPRLAPRPELVTPLVGLVQQGSNMGQFAGPLATGFIVAHWGWSAVPLALVPMALIGLAMSVAIARRLQG